MAARFTDYGEKEVNRMVAIGTAIGFGLLIVAAVLVVSYINDEMEKKKRGF
jgi:hypothetical protein